MQEQRSYLERLEKIAEELFDLRLKMPLDHKEQIEIEASENRINKIYDKQHSFVKSIEKKALQKYFVKQNGRKYTDRDDIIKLR